MATFGEFSSLLQLGVGTGIGLSIFRAPIALRIAILARTFDGEIDALQEAKSEFGKDKRLKLMDKRFEFQGTCEQLENIQLPYMAITLCAAFANLAYLIKASLCATEIASDLQILIMLFISVVIYVIIGAFLEFIARKKLGPIDYELRKIRVSTPSDVPKPW